MSMVTIELLIDLYNRLKYLVSITLYQYDPTIIF